MSERIEQKFKEAVNVLLGSGQIDPACQFFFQYYPKMPKTWDIVLMEQVFQIYQKEKSLDEPNLFSVCKSVEDAVFHYTNVKFLLRRWEFNLPNDLQEEIFTYVENYSVSKTFLRAVAEASVIDLESIRELIEQKL